jgi:hypothetical protein
MSEHWRNERHWDYICALILLHSVLCMCRCQQLAPPSQTAPSPAHTLIPGLKLLVYAVLSYYCLNSLAHALIPTSSTQLDPAQCLDEMQVLRLSTASIENLHPHIYLSRHYQPINLVLVYLLNYYGHIRPHTLVA